MTVLDPRPLIAVPWRPGDRPGDRLAVAILERELRRRLPTAMLTDRLDGAEQADGVIGGASEGANGAPQLVLDSRGCSALGPLAAVADGLDRQLLRRRSALHRAVGWYPAESHAAVVVDGASADGASADGAPADCASADGASELEPHERAIRLGGGDLAARAVEGADHRLPDAALPVDVAAAVAAASRVITDHESVAAAAAALGVKVDWRGARSVEVDRSEITVALDEFAAAVHLHALGRLPLDVIGAGLRRHAAAARRRRQVDAGLRRRLRSVRDELADRIVAHEHDLGRLAAATRTRRW